VTSFRRSTVSTLAFLAVIASAPTLWAAGAASASAAAKEPAPKEAAPKEAATKDERQGEGRTDAKADDAPKAAPRPEPTPLALRPEPTPLALKVEPESGSWWYKVLVAGLFGAVGLWFVRKRMAGGKPLPVAALRVVARQSIGMRSEIVLVEIEGNRRILLGVTPSSIRRLDVSERDEALDAAFAEPLAIAPAPPAPVAEPEPEPAPRAASRPRGRARKAPASDFDGALGEAERKLQRYGRSASSHATPSEPAPEAPESAAKSSPRAALAPRRADVDGATLLSAMREAANLPGGGQANSLRRLSKAAR
jgi:hypothetical protein